MVVRRGVLANALAVTADRGAAVDDIAGQRDSELQPLG